MTDSVPADGVYKTADGARWQASKCVTHAPPEDPALTLLLRISLLNFNKELLAWALLVV